MRGVRSVENRLDVHPRADVPALQGGRARTGDVLDVRQTNWSPTTRLVSGAVGGGLMANCLAKRTPGAILLGTVGFGLFLRSMTNLPLNRLTGIGCRRRAVDVQKTINIAAPVEEVYDFWTNFENFPRFMSHLQEVRDLGNGRSHWVAAGPVGTRASWNAILTRAEPDQLIAWKSEPGSLVASAGCVRFQRTAQS